MQDSDAEDVGKSSDDEFITPHPHDTQRQLEIDVQPDQKELNDIVRQWAGRGRSAQERDERLGNVAPPLNREEAKRLEAVIVEMTGKLMLYNERHAGEDDTGDSEPSEARETVAVGRT